MKKIVVLCATAAALTGCGGGGSGSGKGEACVPNANMSTRSVMVEKSSSVDGENKIVLREEKAISEQGETKTTLLSGESVVEKVNTPSSVEDGSELTIDFAKKTVTVDGQAVSFERDAQLSAAKGRDVFVTNEEQTKAAVIAATNADKQSGLKICSASKAKLIFSFDPANKTVESDETLELAVQLNADSVAAIKGGLLDQAVVVETEE